MVRERGRAPPIDVLSRPLILATPHSLLSSWQPHGVLCGMLVVRVSVSYHVELLPQPAVCSKTLPIFLNPRPTTVSRFQCPSRPEFRARRKSSTSLPSSTPNIQNHHSMASNEIGSWRKTTYFTAEQFHDASKPPVHRLSQSGRRLLWSLQGPLSLAISVLAEACNPDGPREPYMHGNGRHPISHEPITEQPVLILAIKEEDLEGWQDAWWDLNYERFNEDALPALEDAPPTFVSLVVTATNGEFVSIHDYVLTVNTWLMKRRERILQARHVADDDYVPGAVEERLLVLAHNPEMVNVKAEEELLPMLRSTIENNRRR